MTNATSKQALYQTPSMLSNPAQENQFPTAAAFAVDKLDTFFASTFVQGSTTALKLAVGPVVFRGAAALNWQRVSSNPLPTGELTVYCDRCGLNFLPKQSVCTRCKKVPTRYWFQFMSLVTILVAVLCNTVLGLFLLPRLANAHHGRLLFRGWSWFNQQAAFYGWVPLALGLLAWDYFVWKEARPKLKGWLTRKLLTFSLAAGVAPMIPWWIPAGQPPGQFLSMIGKYQGLPVLLAWSVVLVVTIALCIDPESRDYLLGHGRTLSIVSTGMLVLVLAMTLIGWSLTY